MPQRLLITLTLLLCCGPAFPNIEIDIRGIEEEEIRANVLVYLSFERYRKSDDLSPDTVERLHNRVEREVRAALKPFGYYDPSVQSSLEKEGAEDWRVTIDIKRGRPIVMQDISITVRGPGAADPLFTPIVANTPLHRGDRLSHAAYEKIKGDLQRTASTYGYLDAHMVRNELNVDPEAHTASIVLELETGERYHFGATSIEQNAVDERLVRRFIRYREKDSFDLTQVLRTQFALDDSQYFSNVEVLPGTADRETRTVPVSIRADVNRRFRYTFGAGYGTDTEGRGTATWEDRLVNRRGHRFNVELKAAQIEQSLKGRYVVPIGDPALEKLSFEVTAEQRELADLDTESYEFEPSITEMHGRMQVVWFTTLTRINTRSSVEDSTDVLPIPGVTLASVPKGYLGEELFTREFLAELRGSHSTLGSNSDFVQLRVQAERVIDLTPRWHLFLRGEVGGSLVSRFNDLPGPVRFFAGGDRSVRGFGYNDLSPTVDVCTRNASGVDIRNPDGTCVTVASTIKVGGKHLFTGTVEFVRDLPRSLGAAVFADFGNSFDSFGDPLEFSAGLGLRWRLPVVTLGIDIAQPLSEPGAGPRLHINFSPKL